MNQRCLLAVFAHPDDEAFSTGDVLRKYAAEGVRTALVCATRGEAGEISDAALATRDTLGQVREWRGTERFVLVYPPGRPAAPEVVSKDDLFASVRA